MTVCNSMHPKPRLTISHGNHSCLSIPDERSRAQVLRYLSMYQEFFLSIVYILVSLGTQVPKSNSVS